MSWRSLRHPALHVLGLGVVVAVAILVAGGGSSSSEESRRVVISGADLLQLRAAFLRTWQREPTLSELRGQLDEHIRQEVLYREALRRGYDRDDPVVRQAMQRKMEFLASSQATPEAPSEEEVEAFFALRREHYRLPAVLDFVQVYVSPDLRDEGAEQAAEELLERLRREDPEPSRLGGWGDRIMLEPVYRARSEREIVSLFGREFAAAVLEVEPGTWAGPIRSGYGLHLVKVLDRQESRLPEWTEVSARVLADMEYEARRAAKEQLFQEIAQSYQIVFDGPVRELLEATNE